MICFLCVFLGFNLGEHLEKVYEHINDKHVDEINTEQVKIAAAKYKGLSYMDGDEDPIGLLEGIPAGIGKDSKQSIDEQISCIKTEVGSNGISTNGLKRLGAMPEKYRDVLRINLGPDLPAKFEPLRLTLEDNAKPYRSPQRRYAQLQRDFITQTVYELEEVGAIYKNPSARWASPALAVPKPGTTKLRFTVDLRGPNVKTLPIESSMPHLESLFQDISGSTCLAKVDLAYGYWQVLLAKE